MLVLVPVFLSPARPLAKAFLMAPAGDRTEDAPAAAEAAEDDAEAEEDLSGLMAGLRKDDEGVGADADADADAGTGELVLPLLLVEVLRSLALAI